MPENTVKSNSSNSTIIKMENDDESLHCCNCISDNNDTNYSNNHTTTNAVVTNQKKVTNWLESIQIEKLEELLKTDDYCKTGKLDRMDEDGMTLLHRSILANRIEIVQLLISSGANTTLASRDGWSAIHLAAFVGNVDILGFLLKN